MSVVFRPLLPVLCALALTACTSTAPDDRGPDVAAPPASLPSGAEAGTGGGEAVPGTELCDASRYVSLVGQNISVVDLPTGPRLRVFSVNDIVTRDYIPQRTNIQHREDGVVVEVYCG